MSDKATRLGFAPPPHLNAEPHKRLMALLDSMSEEERAEYIFAACVRAGVYTQDGELTEHYKDSDPSSEPVRTKATG